MLASAETLEYRKDVDGLRAIAILSVLFFHLGLGAFAGGYVGVDIFFVISGFLITRLILVERQSTGHFNYSKFYLRRVRRLFPAFIFTTLLVFIGAFLLFSNNLFDNFSLSLISALFSVSNIFFWKTSNYFAPASELEPLLHTWSLGIEEQFYLIWPFLLIILFKYPAKLLLTILLIIVLSMAATESSYFTNDSVFYLLPFRVFEFGIGALVFWIAKYSTKNIAVHELTFAIGLIFILMSVTLFDSSTKFPSIYALVPCVGAALILGSARSRYGSKVLTNSCMVKLGLISYSLYLVHWPLIVFYRYYNNKTELNYIEIIVFFIFSIALSSLMYKFVEQPFRRKAKQQGNNKTFMAGAISVFALIFIASFSVYASHGLSGRTGKFTDFKNINYAAADYPWQTTINPAGNKELILYGDSHSKQYLPALEKFARKYGYKINYLGHPACLSWPGLTNIYQGKIHQSCIKMLEKLEQAIANNSVPVMLAYRYTKNLTSWDGHAAVSYKNQEEYLAYMFNGLDRFINMLGKDRKIILIGNVPTALMPHGYIDCVSRPISSLQCHEKYPLRLGELEISRAKFQQLQQTHQNIFFLDPYIPLCDSEWCYVVRNDALLYSDHAHLTLDGSSAVVSQFSEKMHDFIENEQLQ